MMGKQYSTLRIRGDVAEDALMDIINEYAKEGWRLHSIVCIPEQITHFDYFDPAYAAGMLKNAQCGNELLLTFEADCDWAASEPLPLP